MKMHSLQVLCCIEISFNPERTLHLGLDDLNLQCLELVVSHMSMYDLLKYESSLKQRGVDTISAFYKCQENLLMPPRDTHMGSTTYPHLLALFPRDENNWGLSRFLNHKVIRPLIEQLQGFELYKPYAFDSCLQRSVLEAAGSDTFMQMLCPPGSSERHFEKRKKTLAGDALWNLFLFAAGKILFEYADLKFCRVFTNPRARPVLDLFLERWKVLTVLIRSSPLVLEFVKVFKRQAKSLQVFGLYVVRTKDLLFLDEVLSVCSGVVGFHTTAGGKRDKDALESILLSHGVSLHGELGQEKPGHHLAEDEVDESLDSCPQSGETKKIVNEGIDSGADADDAVNMDGCADSRFDLMDDAVLFGTASPPSNLDSTNGTTRVDLKFTNLVESKFYVSVLEHHLRHWHALRELHLGVPELHPVVLQGLLCVLKRPQFRSLMISSARLCYEQMQAILTTLVSFRASNPLEKLMFVNLSTITDFTFAEANEERDLNAEQFSLNMDPKSTLPDSADGFQGTELLEIYHCVFSIQTEFLLTLFLCRDQALKVLCLKNSFRDSMVKWALQNLAFSDLNQAFHRLILEDWQIDGDSSCAVLKDFLKKMSPSLTGLSLKGCLTDRSCFKVQEIISGVSECSSLHTLDLSENLLGDVAIGFAGAVMKSTQLRELSLKDNRLPADTVSQTVATLQEAAKHRRARLAVLDMRGNKFVDTGQETPGKTLEETIKFLQRSFVDKILYTRQEK